MTAFMAALAVAAAATGLVTAAFAFLPAPEKASKPASRGLAARARAWYRALSRAEKLLLAAGAAAGLYAGLSSGAWILILAVPALGVVLHWMFATTPDKANIPRLDALQSWARSLSGLTTAGQDLENAIRFSLTSTPAAIEPQVRLLVARLNAGWDTQRALQMFAEDVDDPTGDVLVASLMLTARQRTGALSKSLEALAESVSEDIAARREIETERDRPRQVSRYIALIGVLTIAALFLWSHYMTAFSAPGMQVLLVVYLAVFVAGIWLLRRMGIGRQPIRILKANEDRS